MMAVRVNQWKAHYWVWTSYHHKDKPYYFSRCPGQYVADLMSSEVVCKRLLILKVFILRDIGQPVGCPTKTNHFSVELYG